MPVVRQRIPHAVTVLRSRSALSIVPAFLSFWTPHFYRGVPFLILILSSYSFWFHLQTQYQFFDDDSVEHQVRSTRSHLFEDPMLFIILVLTLLLLLFLHLTVSQ